ncbi:MAG: urease subunit gamma [Nitrosopumilaceae archaeon]
MIHIKALVKGEADMAPFTNIFDYDSDSEKIFFSGVEMIKHRLSQNLRININETMMVYAGLVAIQIRLGKSIPEIKEMVESFLSPEKVMVGVPESMRKVVFEVKIDEKPKQIITLTEPIPTTDYILAPK